MAPGSEKTKTFDCVKMKHEAQQEIQAEWQRRKGEFSSYDEFLRAGIRQSKWGRQMLAKLEKTPTAAGHRDEAENL